jgi:hypothetical protein
MRGRDVEGELLDQPREARRLAFGKVQHKSREGRRIDDRVRERAFQASTDEPGIESVVAVLDQHRALSESQERPASVAKLRRADEHRAVDVMALVRVRVDRRLTVHKRVEKGQRAVEPEALRAHFQHQERCVSSGLHVQGHELRIIESGLWAEIRCVDRDLFPRHGLHGSARFEEERFWVHRVCASARRAQSISSLVNPRRSRTAPP